MSTPIYFPRKPSLFGEGSTPNHWIEYRGYEPNYDVTTTGSWWKLEGPEQVNLRLVAPQNIQEGNSHQYENLSHSVFAHGADIASNFNFDEGVWQSLGSWEKWGKC